MTPAQAEILSSQFKDHVFTKLPGGDGQAPNSQSVYNFLPFVTLMVEKVPDVSKIIGELVLPTYTYARVYFNGQDLAFHRDRPACEISITLNLSKDQNWPIWFRKPDGEDVTVEMNPGDGVLYLGCRTMHWRQPYEGKEYTQLFMHYVRAYGEYNWAFFDNTRDDIL